MRLLLVALLCAISFAQTVTPDCDVCVTTGFPKTCSLGELSGEYGIVQKICVLEGEDVNGSLETGFCTCAAEYGQCESTVRQALYDAMDAHGDDGTPECNAYVDGGFEGTDPRASLCACTASLSNSVVNSAIADDGSDLNCELNYDDGFNLDEILTDGACRAPACCMHDSQKSGESYEFRVTNSRRVEPFYKRNATENVVRSACPESEATWEDGELCRDKDWFEDYRVPEALENRVDDLMRQRHTKKRRNKLTEKLQEIWADYMTNGWAVYQEDADKFLYRMQRVLWTNGEWHGRKSMWWNLRKNWRRYEQAVGRN